MRQSFDDGLDLRDATFDDLPGIVEIYNSTIPSRMVTPDSERVTVESRIVWFNEHSPVERPLWILERADEMLGWLSFRDFHERPRFDTTAELSIYVSERARRQGVGSILVDHAVGFAPAIGIKSLIGLILDHNDKSIGLFESRGFERWGLLPGVVVLDEVERDVVILGRRV